jgi:dinuclear metal center YbgI/SA1388 family protein
LGVTACQALIDEARAQNADAILVHHGMFWKSEPEALRGPKYKRIAALIKDDINLYAYHLPLHLHRTLGNNAQLGELFDVIETRYNSEDPSDLLFHGELKTPMNGEEFAAHIAKVLDREPLHIGENAPQTITSIAWCSGGAQDMIDAAIGLGVDAYISGEVSERTTHIARENGIHYYAAGHHATERYGIQALGRWLEENYELEVVYVEINNPV